MSSYNHVITRTHRWPYGPCYSQQSDSVKACVHPSVRRSVGPSVCDAFAFRPSRSDICRVCMALLNFKLLIYFLTQRYYTLLYAIIRYYTFCRIVAAVHKIEEEGEKELNGVKKILRVTKVRLG